MTSRADHLIGLVDRYSAHTYHPLPVVIVRASGVWVEDVDGRRYMDMLAAYSAVNFGHGNPELLDAARAQLERVTLTSRAFHHDQLGPFCAALADLCGMEAVIPMNSGAEGVETAIKTARKWAYEQKGVSADRAKILVAAGNFHGRTTTLVGLSTTPQARAGFGPFGPGFEIVPYGDADALEAAVDDRTAGFLVEPIQGEGGVIVPPDGYLRRVREICSTHNILLIADEIQSGLGRTGHTFACDHESVQPDVLILGKALGGGIMPVSAVVSSRSIFSVFRPGDHGSTFGGNPLGCAIGRQVVTMLERGDYQARARRLGARLVERLRSARYACVEQVRGRGLWVGVVIKTSAGTAHTFCERLMAEGLLCKDTREQVIRLAPPLSISDDELEWACERLDRVLARG